MPNFSSLARLEVPEKFVWGGVGGGLHSHFHAKPNRCVEVRVRVGVLTIFWFHIFQVLYIRWLISGSLY